MIFFKRLESASKRIVKRFLFNYYCAKIDKRKTEGKKRIGIFTILGENWNSFRTMYDYAKDRKDVCVTVFVFPKYDEGRYDIGLYQSTMAFFDSIGVDYTAAYDIATKTWISFDSYRFDYIFYDEPYPVYHGDFSITKIYKKARICYIPYGYSITDSEELTKIVMPETFFCYVSYFFKSTDVAEAFMKQLFKKVGFKNHTIVDLGYPRFDLYDFKENVNKNGEVSVLWIPRYTLPNINMADPSAETSFFEFKDKIIDYAKTNRRVSWIIRPHPSAFSNFVKNGVLNEKDVNFYLKTINEEKNMRIDSIKDYKFAFEESDILLADFSSLIIEYLLTGKPIIYCGNPDAIQEKQLIDAMYCVRNWDEIIDITEKLSNNDDPLLEKRRRYVSSIKKNNRSGEQILDFITAQ